MEEPMKDVLVSGACGGMGKAVIKALLNKGYRVFALDIKECEPCENLIPIKADITSESQIDKAFKTVSEYTDSLYAIMHFAGIYMLDSLVEMKYEDFSRIFEINLHGAFLINKIFLPLVKGGGKILITTSELAPLHPLPFTGIYAVTKGALDKYAYSLRMELQLLGIPVSVLRAGAVDTGMLGASVGALDRFCEKTTLFSCNAERFKKIVNRVEARSITPERLAKKAVKIIEKKRPAFAYKINRNPLLLMLNLLPKPLQLWIIKLVLHS
jgi:NAD(P)-dependent dehydrogenase (short-subunit alcohol dehydrogenase family)